jgi:hypothetical protein
MNFNPSGLEPKQLVSDSLQNVLSEEELVQIEDMFITVVVVIEPRECSLMGNLVGVDFGQTLKIDLKVSLKDAYKFIGNVLVNEKTRRSTSIILTHCGDITNISGPFNVASSKIIEIDPTNKMCIVAIDLIKIAE